MSQQIPPVAKTKKKAKKQSPKQTVKLLGRTIPVTFRKPDKGSFGEYQNMPPEIFINEDLDPVSTRKVLVHEMTHAGLALAGISGYQVSLKAEESICTLMESLLEDIVDSLSKIKMEDET